MYHTTGLSRGKVEDLSTIIWASGMRAGKAGWPPILGLFKSVVVTLTYLRRNRAQAEIAEAFGVSQSTISRAIAAVTPALGTALSEFAPVAEDLDPRDQYIIDGTLLPCWSWSAQPQLYSGKHRTTGLNVQVACDLYGRLAWISDPVDGRRHDSAAMKISGVLDTLEPGNWIGDKGYVGAGMITPIRKPPHRALLDWEKEFNTAVNRIRYMIERTIDNVKTWRILHTDYRRPLPTFKETISAVVNLLFFAAA
jgi:DDE superfamily endonuclease/Helix-turn-helix of DDE superfamily endonuclease